MKNRLILRPIGTLLSVLFVTALALPGAAAEEVDSKAFFPWAIGDAWVYNTTDKKSKDHFEMKVEIDDRWQEAGESGMVMTQRDKRGQMREFQTRNEQGIFIAKLGLKKSVSPQVHSLFNPPVPRVIFPLTPGTKVHWEGRLKIAWVNKPIVFDGTVQDWEEISVPAGTFHCIKLYFHQKRGDDVVDEYAWYAKDIGQVKYEGGQYVKELQSYKIK